MIEKKYICVYLFSLVCFCLAKLSPVSLQNPLFLYSQIVSLCSTKIGDTARYNYMQLLLEWH